MSSGQLYHWLHNRLYQGGGGELHYYSPIFYLSKLVTSDSHENTISTTKEELNRNRELGPGRPG